LRAHARECPRCRGLLDAYRAFIEADASVVTPHELEDADARLSRALADIVGAPTATGAPAPGRPVAGFTRREPSFWDRLLRPAMRPAVAFALIAAVLGAVLLGPRLLPHRGADTLRGGPPAATLRLTRFERTGDVVHLGWSAVPGADAYQLRFFSPSLAELGRVGPVTGESRDIPVSELGFPLADGDTVLVRVVGLAGGDVIATSEARVLASR